MLKKSRGSFSFLPEFAKIGKREKTLIIAILIGSFLVGLIASGSYNKLTGKVEKDTTPASSENTSSAKLATVGLTTGNSTVNKGETFTATLYLNSPDQGVEAADFAVEFDPTYINVENVATGNFFANYPKKETGEDSVIISGIATFTDREIKVPKGEGTVATITFKAIEETDSTYIRLNSEKTIVGSRGKNIAGPVEDLLVKIE